MGEVAGDVERDPVHGDPAPHAHADRGELGLAGRRLDPDADAALTGKRLDAESADGADEPGLEARNVGPEIGTLGPAAGGQIEHDVGHALPGPVISVLAASSGDEDGEAAGVEKLRGPGAGSGGIEGRMLEQPDLLARRALANPGDALVHIG